MKRTIAILLCAALSLLTFASCGILGTQDTKNKGYAMEKVNSNITEANTEFAFNIFRALHGEDAKQSIFISPLSISTALTMAYNGAETTTKEAMHQSLGYTGMERERVNESYKNLLAYLQGVDKKVELNIANSIWIRDGESIEEGFIETNKSNFNAQVASLDFSKDAAVDTMNDWISKATKGKIDKMLEPPIDPLVMMYLINAIYFKGQWSIPFNPDKTFDSTFHTLDKELQSVRMMSRNGKVDYIKGEDYKAVRLPYGSGKTSMIAILPDNNIDAFIQDLDPDKWKDIRNNLIETQDVQLQIPKFKLEYGIKNLNDSLASLGMEVAFSDQADFSGIRPDLYISRVLHKAVIEVNEEGSEAAAATVVEMRTTSAGPEPTTFIADKPFVFIITDDETETILFMGMLSAVD